MASFGDNLSGGGLGSSSSFTVALLKGIYELKNMEISSSDAAHLASEIEIKNLEKPIGRQDQYLCSLGGINILRFNKDKIVNSIENSIIIEAVEIYLKDLFIVNTGVSRSATKVLKEIKQNNKSYDSIKQIFNITKSFLKIQKIKPKSR